MRETREEAEEFVRSLTEPHEAEIVEVAYFYPQHQPNLNDEGDVGEYNRQEEEFHHRDRAGADALARILAEHGI